MITSRLLSFVLIAGALGVSSNLVAATAPVTCRLSQGDVEKAICASPEYIAMDREIAALIDRGMAQLTAGDRHRLADSQTRYLKQRKGCGWASHHSAHPGAAVDECIRTSMEERVHALRVLVDRRSY